MKILISCVAIILSNGGALAGNCDYFDNYAADGSRCGLRSENSRVAPNATSRELQYRYGQIRLRNEAVKVLIEWANNSMSQGYACQTWDNPISSYPIVYAAGACGDGDRFEAMVVTPSGWRLYKDKEAYDAAYDVFEGKKYYSFLADNIYFQRNFHAQGWGFDDYRKNK